MTMMRRRWGRCTSSRWTGVSVVRSDTRLSVGVIRWCVTGGIVIWLHLARRRHRGDWFEKRATVGGGTAHRCRGARRRRAGRSSSITFSYLDPFRIVVIVSQQMLTRRGIVLLDRPNVPTIIDGPKHSHLFPHHAVGAEPDKNSKRSESKRVQGLYW